MSVRVVLLIALLANLSFGSTALAEPESPSTALQAFDSDLSAKCAAGDFSGVVSATLGGQSIYLKTCGYADREKKTLMTRDTSFKIFSISKSMTATAILSLADARKFSLSDPVGRSLPELPPLWRVVTIKQLLQHTSGVPDLTETLLTNYQASPKAGWDGAMRLAISSAKDALLEPAGTKWRYNNFGYELLAYVAERVTRKPFAQVLQDRVFRLAGMKAATVARPRIVHGKIDGSQPSAGLAIGYACKAQGGGPLISYSFVQLGAGAVYATVDDFERFDRALRAGRLVSKNMQNRIPEEAFGDTGGVPYGYGWLIRQSCTTTYLQHDGGNNGFVSDFARGLTFSFTATVLSNDSCADVFAIRKSLVEALVARRAAQARASK